MLCNGDLDRTIKMEVWDWDKRGGDDYIGSFTTNLRVLQESGRRDFEVVNEAKKKKKKKYRNSGVVKLNSCECIRLNSFLDYVAGGCEIGVCTPCRAACHVCMCALVCVHAVPCAFRVL